jgi:hypothetical protein
MPNANIDVGTSAVLLTSSNVTSCRVQNVSGYYMLIQATVGATPPTSFAGAIQLAPGQGEYLVLADAYPGVAGANRLYAFSPTTGATASVSYA